MIKKFAENVFNGFGFGAGMGFAYYLINIKKSN